MSTDSSAPDTVVLVLVLVLVLVHGLWMTPRSWEHWVTHYENQGLRVLTPTYPRLEVEVEALRADPSAIASLTVPETVAHLEGVIEALEWALAHATGAARTPV